MLGPSDKVDMSREEPEQMDENGELHLRLLCVTRPLSEKAFHRTQNPDVERHFGPVGTWNTCSGPEAVPAAGQAHSCRLVLHAMPHAACRLLNWQCCAAMMIGRERGYMWQFLAFSLTAGSLFAERR